MNRAVQDLAAEALFVSDIQPSERPTRHAITQTITAMLLCYGNDGCAAEFAAQFGDHPDTAARRMSWARGELNRRHPRRHSGP
ncbi:MAG TPA: hypothetical protein VFG35_06330 [Actinoplanes sp.]|nr:hypothetical protein [Actinoplanes sp.]